MSGGPLGPRAKQPTKEEIQERRDAMFELDQSIRQSLMEGRAAIWRLAAFLDLWDEQNGWTALGCETLHDWLGDPEIAMTKGRFYDLVGTYRELTKRGVPAKDMKELEYTKVRTVLPALRQNRVKLEDALDAAKNLSQSDLREEFRDPASGQPDTHKQESEEKPALPPDSEPIQADEVEPDDGDVGSQYGVILCPHCGNQVDLDELRAADR